MLSPQMPTGYQLTVAISWEQKPFKLSTALLLQILSLQGRSSP